LNNLQSIPCDYSENAAHVDFDRRKVTLFSGRQLPIVQFWDDEGCEIEDASLDLHEEIVVVYGPDAGGTLYAHPMRRGDRVTVQ
jgi:hypothetical protein